MDLVSFLWLIFIALATSAGGAGIGVLGMTPPRYQYAEISFLISGMCCLGIAILFGVTVPVRPIWRIVGTGLIGALAAIGTVEALFWVRTIEPPLVVKSAESGKDANLAMARRWIRLADEISADLPPLQNSFEPPFMPTTGMTPELWKQQTDRSQRAFETLMDSMRLKYRGRIAAVRDEILRNGIPLTRSNPSDVFLTDPTLMLVNHFSFMEWANKLNIEGRSVLSSYGVSE